MASLQVETTDLKVDDIFQRKQEVSAEWVKTNNVRNKQVRVIRSSKDKIRFCCNSIQERSQVLRLLVKPNALPTVSKVKIHGRSKASSVITHVPTGLIQRHQVAGPRRSDTYQLPTSPKNAGHVVDWAIRNKPVRTQTQNYNSIGTKRQPNNMH